MKNEEEEENENRLNFCTSNSNHYFSNSFGQIYGYDFTQLQLQEIHHSPSEYFQSCIGLESYMNPFEFLTGSSNGNFLTIDTREKKIIFFF